MDCISQSSITKAPSTTYSEHMNLVNITFYFQQMKSERLWHCCTHCSEGKFEFNERLKTSLTFVYTPIFLRYIILVNY